MHTFSIPRTISNVLYQWASTIYTRINPLINYYFGYNQSLLGYPSLDYLEYLLNSRHVDKDYNQNGFNALHKAAVFTVDQEERIELLLDHGVDVNCQEHQEFNNTPLHTLIANENTVIAKFLIDKARKKGIIIDFNLLDKNYCNSLLLASKTRQEDVALHILEQHTDHRADINLDQKDIEGRTALDYAIILGQFNLSIKLFSLGAKPGVITEDFSNLDLFGEELIREILTQIKINPDRDENALLNSIHDKNKQDLMMMRRLSGIDLPQPLILLANKCENNTKILEMLKNPELPLIDTKVLAYQQKFEYMSKEERQFIQEQYKSFSGKTLLSKCLREQAIIKSVWSQYFPSSKKISSGNFLQFQSGKADGHGTKEDVKGNISDRKKKSMRKKS